jgi:hypothetical protein
MRDERKETKITITEAQQQEHEQESAQQVWKLNRRLLLSTLTVANRRTGNRSARCKARIIVVRVGESFA